MKVLVTGGAGFIGSHIAEAYVAKGHTVVVVDDLSTGNIDNIPNGARFEQMSITSDAFDALCDAERFDLINHHAAHMELRVSVDKPLHDANVNILGSIRVLEAARRNGVKHCVVASTAAVLGDFVHIPADESHPTRPIAPYGVSKLAVEYYVNYYRTSHGMSISTLRYTNVYGPRQNPFGESGVIGIFLHKFLNGETATIHGDGTQVRDYIYVSDVVGANLAAAEQQLNGTYMICANSETSVNQVVEMLRNALEILCVVANGPAKVGDPARTRGTHELFTSTSGWAPQVGINAGISMTTMYFRALRDVRKNDST